MDLLALQQSIPTRVSHGRPASNLTDREWQVQFSLARLYIQPHPDNITKMGGRFSRAEMLTSGGIYDGMTNWQSYCSFINDVLKQIRKGNRDFVYFGYQIMELLKFHHDTLRTRYCGGYWEVWLER